MISGDKLKIKVEVSTNMRIKTFIQEFLVLESSTKSLVIENQWHLSSAGKFCGDSTRLVNIETFWTKMTMSTEDKADEDELLDGSNIDVYPESSAETRRWNLTISSFRPWISGPRSVKVNCPERNGSIFSNASTWKISRFIAYNWKWIRMQDSECSRFMNDIFCALKAPSDQPASTGCTPVTVSVTH